MKNSDLILIIEIVAMIVTIAICMGISYLIAISDLPNWFKYLLLVLLPASVVLIQTAV